MTIKENLILLEEEYRRLTAQEIEIAKRKRDLEKQINNIKDRIALRED